MSLVLIVIIRLLGTLPNMFQAIDTLLEYTVFQIIDITHADIYLNTQVQDCLKRQSHYFTFIRKI